MTGWTTQTALALARLHLQGSGDRWLHVQAVGRCAEDLCEQGLVGDELVQAAWLHDIGYAPAIAATGFHALDGARYLQRMGAPAAVVALVGAHTGAAREALERGLSGPWSQLPVPDPDELDVLTLMDLATSPTGQPVQPADRLAEILRRYPLDSPVGLAVSHGVPDLLAAATRARRRLQLTDSWPLIHAAHTEPLHPLDREERP